MFSNTLPPFSNSQRWLHNIVLSIIKLHSLLQSKQGSSQASQDPLPTPTTKLPSDFIPTAILGEAKCLEQSFIIPCFVAFGFVVIGACLLLCSARPGLVRSFFPIFFVLLIADTWMVQEALPPDPPLALSVEDVTPTRMIVVAAPEVLPTIIEPLPSPPPAEITVDESRILPFRRPRKKISCKPCFLKAYWKLHLPHIYIARHIESEAASPHPPRIPYEMPERLQTRVLCGSYHGYPPILVNPNGEEIFISRYGLR